MAGELIGIYNPDKPEFQLTKIIRTGNQLVQHFGDGSTNEFVIANDGSIYDSDLGGADVPDAWVADSTAEFLADCESSFGEGFRTIGC